MTDMATRLWVAAFVVLVFVSGLSIGLAVSARMGAGDPANRFRGPGRSGFRPGPPGLVSERIIGRLEGEPGFTEDQRERLEALFAERESRFRQFNREMRQRFEAEQASLRDGVAAILTPARCRSLMRPDVRVGGGQGRVPPGIVNRKAPSEHLYPLVSWTGSPLGLRPD